MEALCLEYYTCLSISPGLTLPFIILYRIIVCTYICMRANLFYCRLNSLIQVIELRTTWIKITVLTTGRFILVKYFTVTCVCSNPGLATVWYDRRLFDPKTNKLQVNDFVCHMSILELITENIYDTYVLKDTRRGFIMCR